MIAIEFDQANIRLAENQPEYETLPIWMDVDDNGIPVMIPVKQPDGSVKDQPRSPMGEAVCCFQLNKEEIDEIVRTGKLYFTQCTFWKPYSPINMSTENPFKP